MLKPETRVKWIVSGSLLKPAGSAGQHFPLFLNSRDVVCIVRHPRSEEHFFSSWASQTHFIERTFQRVHSKIQHTPKALNKGWTDSASWLVSETLFFFFFGQWWATSETSVKDLDGRSQRGTTVHMRHIDEWNQFVKLFVSRNLVMDPNSQRTKAGGRRSAAGAQDSCFLIRHQRSWSKCFESLSQRRDRNVFLLSYDGFGGRLLDEFLTPRRCMLKCSWASAPIPRLCFLKGMTHH